MQLIREHEDIVWLDETWIYRRGGMKYKCWQHSLDLKSVPVKTINNGKRYIVIHAGGKHGFVQGAGHVFASKSNALDYHGEMNAYNFDQWFRDKLLPNLRPNSLIIMDNASYHTAQALTSTFLAWCDFLYPYSSYPCKCHGLSKHGAFTNQVVLPN